MMAVSLLYLYQMKRTFYVMAILFYLILFNSCSSSQINRNQFQFEISPDNKINGLSFVASPRKVDSIAFIHIDSVAANWISLMPFAYMPAADQSELYFNQKDQWWGERVEGVKATVEMAHQKSIQVCLKPQIWIGNGTFTGLIHMNSESNWIAFENNYREYLLTFAKLASETQVEYVCIGTELQQFVADRPVFWNALIDSIRSIYSGQLTYAENWDCFDKVPFWSKLDAVGVDAYFPLSPEKKPTIAQLKLGWQTHLEKLKACSEKENKPILFTEFGYRSMDFCAKSPWDYSNEYPVNQQAQAIALQALFETVWNKDWFAGGFLWKWFPERNRHLGENDTQFSPQGKKAEAVVKNWYRNYLK